MAKATKMFRMDPVAAFHYAKNENKLTRALIDFWSKRESFSRKEFTEITALVIASQPGYGRFGGGDYAKLEAGHKFSAWHNINGIIEEVFQDVKSIEIPVFLNLTVTFDDKSD
jgi:hypothetical protein